MIKLLLYADDITMYVSGKDVNNLICAVNNELVIINNWFISNRLTLNLNKSSFTIFHSSKKSVSFDSSLSINSSLLNMVTQIRYLGILMDEHLTWSKHISYIQNLIAKNIGVISRIRPFINTKIALLLYFSLIYPYLTYCNVVWASTYHSHLDRLNVLQKRIIRIVFLLPFLSSTKSTFVNNNLLNIYQIHSLQIALFMFSYDYNAVVVV